MFIFFLIKNHLVSADIEVLYTALSHTNEFFSQTHAQFSLYLYIYNIYIAFLGVFWLHTWFGLRFKEFDYSTIHAKLEFRI